MALVQNKTQFVENIQKWVAAERQLRLVNEKTKELRDYKHQLTSDICSYISENNLTNTKIELSDGELRTFEKKDYSPLTFGYIEGCLADLIPDKSHVSYIMDHLRAKREIKTTTDLRRTYKK